MTNLEWLNYNNISIDEIEFYHDEHQGKILYCAGNQIIYSHTYRGMTVDEVLATMLTNKEFVSWLFQERKNPFGWHDLTDLPWSHSDTVYEYTDNVLICCKNGDLHIAYAANGINGTNAFWIDVWSNETILAEDVAGWMRLPEPLVEDKNAK